MMSRVYSTEELIQILADERKACMRGMRLKLNASPTGIHPFLDRFVRPEGIQKFTAYSDFRSTIHDYQRENQVSGMVWQRVTVRGNTLDYPRVDDQLIALPEDLVLLQSYQERIFAFWQSVTQGMDLYLSVNNGKDFRQISEVEVNQTLRFTEWATLWKHENSQFLEVVLQLGWGQPSEALYRRGFPDSGSEYIHAVHPGNRPIC